MVLTKSTPNTTSPSTKPITSKTTSSSTTPAKTSSTKTSGTSAGLTVNNNRSVSGSPTPTKTVSSGSKVSSSTPTPTKTTTSSATTTKTVSSVSKTSTPSSSTTKPVGISKVTTSSKPSGLSSSPKATSTISKTSSTSSALKTKTGTTSSSSPSKASQPTVSKQLAVNTPVKPKTPLPKAQQLEDELNRLVCKLPSEVLLIILDFYGGLFDQSCGSNVKKFNQMYFGKFTKSGQREDSPKFLFRRLELDGTKMYHRSELLRMTQCLAANGAKVQMKAPYVKLLHDTTITDGQQALNQTKKTLKVLPVQNITTLNVRQLPTQILISILEAMSPYLEDITILQIASSDTCDMDRFSKLKFPKLRIFRWRGPSAGKDDDFTEFSTNSPALTTLDIQTSTTSIFRFSKALKNWQNLRTVKSILKGENGGSIHGYATLYDTPSEDIQKEFFENLGACSKLSTISLDHERLLPGMLKNLAGTSIKTAEITSCGLGAGFDELLTIPSLKKLKLGTYEETYNVTTDIVCDLVDLNIFRTPIFTVERLSQLKNLKTLALINQDIDDKFVEAISKELTLLETIDLSENPITNNSILSISKNCPKITSIRAISTGVSNFTLPKEIKYLVVK